MTWEETITYIQNTPSFASLVRDTYIAADLPSNVERFRSSVEFKETQLLLKKYVAAPAPKLLDIGAGNGVASVSFALSGYQVTALEPDKSMTVGSGAIKTVADYYQLTTIQVIESFGERLPFDDESFDIIYVRQALHHALDLTAFVKEAGRVLKKQGIMLTLRDHVVRSEREKKRFLARHPLHRYYGGENAFSLSAYREAFKEAGLTILQQISPSASPINYDPWSKTQLIQILSAKFGQWIATHHWLIEMAWWLSMIRKEYLPGKLYSFVVGKRSFH
jgi:ubiquinone/menaquinone biosynthesis C-methylase UbiE